MYGREAVLPVQLELNGSQKEESKPCGEEICSTVREDQIISLKNKSDGKVLARRVHGNRQTTFHERHTHDIIGIEDISLLENDAYEVKLSQNECNVAEKVGAQFSTRDESANDERNTSMVVPKNSSTDGGINIYVVKEDIPPHANPVIFEQLYSPHILRLWRTGAAEFGYSPNEDEAFDIHYASGLMTQESCGVRKVSAVVFQQDSHPPLSQLSYHNHSDNQAASCRIKCVDMNRYELAHQNRYELSPEFPLASPYSGIVLTIEVSIDVAYILNIKSCL
ncbi:hypothetical protein EMCRGX_G016760 [Ephydatia muelleri]